MNATINGIDYTDPKEAKAAIRRAQAHARKEEKATNARYNAAWTLARLGLADVVSMIERKMDGRRINWSPKRPQIKRNGFLDCVTYFNNGGFGTYEHYGVTPEVILESSTGDKAVKIDGTWASIGVNDGMVVFHEIPAFLAPYLDEIAAGSEV